MSAPITFPGLIPGLAGGTPGQGPANARQQLPTPPSTAPSDESTGQRINRLEALTANQAQEIFSLRRNSSASREEVDGLRLRVAELEASLQTPFSINYSRSTPPAIGQAPFSINYPHSGGVQPKWETPVREKKRSRFATFFEQMAATSADRKDSHGKEMEAVPVLAATPSTELTAHCYQVVTPPTASVRVDSYDVYDDPYPWGGRFGQPDFDFTASVPTTHLYPQYHEMDFYGWLHAPHAQQTEENADPFPWGGRFGKPDFDFAASAVGDVHCKEMQACGALQAPRPIHPKAPLLSKAEF